MLNKSVFHALIAVRFAFCVCFSIFSPPLPILSLVRNFVTVNRHRKSLNARFLHSFNHKHRKNCKRKHNNSQKNVNKMHHTNRISIKSYIVFLTMKKTSLLKTCQIKCTTDVFVFFFRSRSLFGFAFNLVIEEKTLALNVKLEHKI